MKPKTTTFAFVVSVTMEDGLGAKPMKVPQMRRLLRELIRVGHYYRSHEPTDHFDIRRVTIVPVKES